jgi:hypothetical protein
LKRLAVGRRVNQAALASQHLLRRGLNSILPFTKKYALTRERKKRWMFSAFLYNAKRGLRESVLSPLGRLNLAIPPLLVGAVYVGSASRLFHFFQTPTVSVSTTEMLCFWRSVFVLVLQVLAKIQSLQWNVSFFVWQSTSIWRYIVLGGVLRSVFFG